MQLIRIYAQPTNGSPAVFEQKVEQATSDDIKKAVSEACDSLDFVPERVLVTKTEVQP